jgi:nucleotide-binding universal stress UspA family protein
VERTKILVAHDGSIHADAAIEDLRRAGLPDEADALVLCVADGNTHTLQSIGLVETELKGSWRGKLADAEAVAESAGTRLQSHFPHWTISVEALWGSAADVILKRAGGWHPDLLVAGSHGRSAAGRVFLGSVSLELVQRAPCSVRVVRTGESCGIGPIRLVAGHDGSPQADAAIKAIGRRSWPQQTEIELVSAVQSLVPAMDTLQASTYAQEPAFNVIRNSDEHEWARLQNAADDAADYLRRAGLLVNTTVVDGDPRQLILEKADVCRADAVFVGARGLGRLDRLLLGSVSTHVVNHARCSVEVVRLN